MMVKNEELILPIQQVLWYWIEVPGSIEGEKPIANLTHFILILKWGDWIQWLCVVEKQQWWDYQTWDQVGTTPHKPQFASIVSTDHTPLLQLHIRAIAHFQTNINLWKFYIYPIIFLSNESTYARNIDGFWQILYILLDPQR